MSLPVLSLARVLLRDLSGGPRDAAAAPAKRLAAAAAWLERAQDATADDGVSRGFSLAGGWRPSCTATSGGVALTFFDLAAAWNAPRLRERAVRIAAWLAKQQNGDGSFPSSRPNGRRGFVFDTAEDLFALVRAHEETGEEPCLKSARLAGDWLVEVAGGEGRWTRHAEAGVPRTFDAHAAWALLELDRVDGGSEYHNAGWKRVAAAQLDWTASRQQPNGCFADCNEKPDAAPTLPAIAHTIRALLEAWRLDGNANWLAAARRGAKAVREQIAPSGFLAGRIGEDGHPLGHSTCPMGTCQMAIVWARLHGNVERAGDRASREAAEKVLRHALRTQDLATGDPGVRGAIPGSQPTWGSHAPLCFPSGAARFFLDAVLLCEEWLG